MGPDRGDRAARAEARLAEIYAALQEHRTAGGSTVSYLVRHPRVGIEAALCVSRLPLLTAELGDSAEATVVRDAISLGASALGPLTHKAVLRLPARATDYSAGSQRQTLRRKVRQARACGIEWRRVDDPVERRRVLRLADEWERGDGAGTYRNTGADNRDLLAQRLWLVAYSGVGGRPLLLAVAPYDGEWAYLRHFRTIGSGEEQSLARYLMTQVLVEELVPRGVRVVLDARVPAALPNGLRHFQRMVGFRVVRIRSVRRSRAAAAPEQRTASPVLAATAG